MKGELNKYGALLSERAGKMKHQNCPHRQNEDNACGDWCPMFREPEDYGHGTDIKIDICNDTLWFDEFEDKR